MEHRINNRDDKHQTDRAVYWFILVYPDSAVDGWVDILRNQGLHCAISPIHNKDTDDDGKLLKPHYHVLIRFKTNYGIEHLSRIIEEINAFPHCEIVEDPLSAYTYLYHGDYS